MKSIAESLPGGAADWINRGLGDAIAWIVFLFIIVTLVILAYVLMKAFGFGAKPDGRIPTLGEDAVNLAAWSPESVVVPESRKEFFEKLETVKRGGFEFYKYLTYAIVAVFVAGGIYFASVATTGNGYIYYAIWLFAVAAVFYSQLERFQQLIAWKPSINFTKTVTIGEPNVYKLDTNALQQAQDLLRGGKEIGSVCREINPEYANWGSIQQQLFQKTLEAVLKSQGSSGS